MAGRGTTIARFLGDDSGATAIEYGLIAALMAVAAILAFTIFGDSLTNMFAYVYDNAGAAMSAATT